mgnify:CR=1 FL=1
MFIGSQLFQLNRRFRLMRRDITDTSKDATASNNRPALDV